MMGRTVQIKLMRSIILGGGHAEQGSLWEVSVHLAANLIVQGSAVHHLGEGDRPLDLKSLLAMDRSTDPGPAPRKISGAPMKVKN
jgi:hypothetical protein